LAGLAAKLGAVLDSLAEAGKREAIRSAQAQGNPVRRRTATPMQTRGEGKGCRLRTEDGAKWFAANLVALKGSIFRRR
jgi:hypothetical protein